MTKKLSKKQLKNLMQNNECYDYEYVSNQNLSSSESSDSSSESWENGYAKADFDYRNDYQKMINNIQNMSLDHKLDLLHTIHSMIGEKNILKYGKKFKKHKNGLGITLVPKDEIDSKLVGLATLGIPITAYTLYKLFSKKKK